MQKSPPAVDALSYVAALQGWRLACVKALRATVLDAAKVEEVVKWGNLVYLSNGAVALNKSLGNPTQTSKNG